MKQLHSATSVKSSLPQLLHRKTADHCHLSGKYRQALCDMCNQKLRTPNFVPCYFHDLSNYDSHLIVLGLGQDSNSINVIPNNEENSYRLRNVSNTFPIRFIDTFQFMASSLSSLAKNLITFQHEHFRETAKVFSSNDMPLVTRKSVFPYEYLHR